jgi:GMP synthase-like glutamine amidotransferase
LIGTLDLVIAMRGPMSVHDEREYTWLRPEKRFIQKAIGRGMPVIGACLGAQLIATVLGARVYANAEREIGWHPVEGMEPGEAAFGKFVQEEPEIR